MKLKNELKILRFEELSSTQEYCKAQTGEEDLFVVASRQSAGHGTKNRSFSSLDGGLYFSMLLHPEGFAAENAFLIMAKTATAVCKTLEEYGLQPKIKWPNDIHLQGKKACGILIENRIVGKRIASSVIGVGLNLNNELPKELQEIAVSVSEALREKVDLREAEEIFRRRFFSEFDFSEYTARLGYLGEEIGLTVGETEQTATLLGVDEKGLLMVRISGEEKRFSAGEVTVREWKK